MDFRLLDDSVKKFNVVAFIDDDPVQFPRRFTELRDIEIVAFLVATIAWGRRQMILRDAERLLQLMENKPFEFFEQKKDLVIDVRDNIHRTFFASDLQYFGNGFRSAYSCYESLEELFLESPTNLWEGLKKMRNFFAHVNRGLYSTQFPDPDKSACKRLHLALRWLVRADGIVDLGIWKRLSPSALQIPLDVHVANNARKIGLTTRKSNDRKTVEDITAHLREMNPEDPIKYDFALFSL